MKEWDRCLCSAREITSCPYRCLKWQTGYWVSDPLGMFQICFIRILVLGYLDHGSYCSSLCLPERKYIGKNPNPEKDAQLRFRSVHTWNQDSSTDVQVSASQALYNSVGFFFVVYIIFCIHCQCVPCSRCEFQWRSAGGCSRWVRPSRWGVPGRRREVVQLQLRCCLLSHHCGAGLSQSSMWGVRATP